MLQMFEGTGNAAVTSQRQAVQQPRARLARQPTGLGQADAAINCWKRRCLTVAVVESRDCTSWRHWIAKPAARPRCLAAQQQQPSSVAAALCVDFQRGAIWPL